MAVLPVLSAAINTLSAQRREECGCKSTARLAVAPTPHALTHVTRGGVSQVTELGKAALGAPNVVVKALADSGN